MKLAVAVAARAAERRMDLAGGMGTGSASGGGKQ